MSEMTPSFELRVGQRWLITGPRGDIHRETEVVSFTESEIRFRVHWDTDRSLKGTCYRISRAKLAACGYRATGCYFGVGDEK